MSRKGWVSTDPNCSLGSLHLGLPTSQPWAVKACLGWNEEAGFFGPPFLLNNSTMAKLQGGSEVTIFYLMLLELLKDGRGVRNCSYSGSHDVPKKKFVP